MGLQSCGESEPQAVLLGWNGMGGQTLVSPVGGVVCMAFLWPPPTSLGQKGTHVVCTWHPSLI